MSSQQRALLARAFVCLWLCVSCRGSQARLAGFEANGQSVSVQKPALYPETIEYDAKRDEFLLGSFRDGAIYRVDRAGGIAALVDDPRLCSVLGIAVDAQRDRLWAVSSDLGASRKPSLAGPKKLADVMVYELSTGKPLSYVDLAPLAAGPHLLNGIALDSAGNAYVTDSFSPVIYKLDAHGNASVFVNDQRFRGEAVSLNGVVVHPDGYLLVIKKSDGSLFKIPLEQPTKLAKVGKLRPLVGGDGVTLVGRKSLVVIANRTPQTTANAAYSLTSEDDWVSASVVAERFLGDVYPTTAVLRKGTLYVVHSKLNELLSSPPERKAELAMSASILEIGRISYNP